MSGHHPRRSTLHRHPAHPALWAAAAVIIVFAAGACTSTNASPPIGGLRTHSTGSENCTEPEVRCAGRHALMCTKVHP